MIDVGEMAATNALSTNTSKPFIDAQLYTDAVTRWLEN